MRLFQEEIVGPALSLISFPDFDDAMAIADDPLPGPGAGVHQQTECLQVSH